MKQIQSQVNGAISLVNAIAAGHGATMGIGLKTTCNLKISDGVGISIKSNNRSLSSRLVEKTVEHTVSARDLSKHKLQLELCSNIPTGYGLKSSSAISLAVAMCCTKAFKSHVSDKVILSASAKASIAAGVSITGAYDDACSCYFGGINITDNKSMSLVRRDGIPQDLGVVIFVPRQRRRGKPAKLSKVKSALQDAWDLIYEKSDYWNAMTLNGLAVSSILGPHPSIITSLIEAGALGASVSGNGPAVAAVSKKRDIEKVKRVFLTLDGTIMDVSPNGKKSRCYVL